MKCPQGSRFNLETEANAELRLERNSEWFRKTSRAEEVDGPAKVRLAGHVLKLVTEVSSVEDVERLEEQSKRGFSPNLKNFETRTFNCENMSPRSLFIGSLF